MRSSHDNVLRNRVATVDTDFKVDGIRNSGSRSCYRAIMGLFEIVTGHIGCSFERCYVWAENRKRAAEMFREHHLEREIKEVTLIVHRDDGEFITELNDEGVGERIAR